MTAKIVGYEGSLPPGVFCSWGSAAIVEDGKLYNAGFGKRGGGTPLEEVDDETWACIQKVKEVELPEGTDWEGATVFEMPYHAHMRNPYKFADDIDQRIHGVIAAQIDIEKGRAYYVFHRYESLTVWLTHMHIYNLMQEHSS